jgi:hypothetical protein
MFDLSAVQSDVLVIVASVFAFIVAIGLAIVSMNMISKLLKFLIAEASSSDVSDSEVAEMNRQNERFYGR